MYLKLALIGLSLFLNSAMAERFDRATMDSHYGQFCVSEAKYEGMHPAYALAQLYSSIHPSDAQGVPCFGRGIPAHSIDYVNAHETAKAIYVTGHIWGLDPKKTANAKEFDSAFTGMGQLLTLGEGLAFQAEVNRKFEDTKNHDPKRGHMEVLNLMVNGNVDLIQGLKKGGVALKQLKNIRPRDESYKDGCLEGLITQELYFFAVDYRIAILLPLVKEQADYLTALFAASPDEAIARTNNYGLDEALCGRFLVSLVQQRNEQLLKRILKSHSFTKADVREALESAVNAVYVSRGGQEQNGFGEIIQALLKDSRLTIDTLQSISREYLEAAPREFSSSAPTPGSLNNTKLYWFLTALIPTSQYQDFFKSFYGEKAHAGHNSNPGSFPYLLEEYVRGIIKGLLGTK